ncbi:MAG: sodium/solute symporter [Opitutales bacterium]|nr:sodium/solute symporter [Opitutales bacterium]
MIHLTAIDIAVFALFVIAVVGVGMIKGRSKGGSEDYFLAGRGLSWWLIGFSLIAANISTEQFVGMSGQAADYLGLAIASYEWMAAITLVVVAFFFLPKFLRTGIYTVPEFLEHRYTWHARTVMAGLTMITYVIVTITAVIYSGALTIHTLFPNISLIGGAVLIALIAAVYVVTGGLKACAWADLLQGSALILGGAIITWFAFHTLGSTPLDQLAYTATEGLEGLTDASGGVEKFFALNSDKLHMVLPANDLILPCTALMVGLWIPNFYYWGLNQYITQRTLGSHSLAEGQKGIVFAAALKLIVPFVIVFPGIIAFNIYSDDLAEIASKDVKIQGNWAMYEDAKVNLGAGEDILIFSVDKAFQVNESARYAEIAAYNANAEALAAEKGIATKSIALAGYKYDSAFGLLIGKLIPGGKGVQGFILAAILGAVVSSLASMLNAASTIFTMDIYKRFIAKDAAEKKLVLIGRFCVGIFVAIGCLLTPVLADPKFGGVFTFIQEFQGFISPGILAIFVFAFAVKKAPRICGVVGLIASPVLYGSLMALLPGVAFLDRMAITFGAVLLILLVLTLVKPLKEPFELPDRATIAMDSSASAKIGGIIVVVLTLVLYGIFW